MSDVVLKRGMERVEVDSSQVTAEILRRTFRVRIEGLKKNFLCVCVINPWLINVCVVSGVSCPARAFHLARNGSDELS